MISKLDALWSTDTSTKVQYIKRPTDTHPFVAMHLDVVIASRQRHRPTRNRSTSYLLAVDQILTLAEQYSTSLEQPFTSN